ncbi:hypothetical protein PHMEG_0003897 [Phytophthora megakarya]|uniref:Uncharacterized protein n=1 Tax=Phytophthora megakarya TaxID=4795 RepID=A0A225WV94_9STRA|nr:hypothetical protein PHMEG_0003897 [Phytophthora megakarya]
MEAPRTASPRVSKVPRQLNLVSLASTKNGNEEKRGEGNGSPKTAPNSADHDTSSKHESEMIDTKCPVDGDKSEDEQFNVDDSDGENEGVKAATPAEKDDSSSSAETKMRFADVDIEDLYDCPPGTHREQNNDIELFHVVLTEDTDRLKQFLDDISPQEMLEIVDTSGRTLYHYAALSRDKLLRDMIYQHVNFYHDAQFENELQDLMRKKAQMWMQDRESNGKGWIPPRVKELRRSTTQAKCADWKRVFSSVDKNGRTFLHYKLALHYAVDTGNLKQVKWYFQMGIKLTQVDVDVLLSMNVTRVMENAILRQLEAIDIEKHYRPSSRHDIDENDDRCDPGVSTFALVKLQRTAKHNVGHMHQLLLHRAAKFGNLWTECYNGNVAHVRRLLLACPNQSAQQSVGSVSVKDITAQAQRSPLHLAVLGYMYTIQPHERSSTPVSSQGDRLKHDKLSDLYRSAPSRFLQIVALLLQAGANLSAPDKWKITPLMLASCVKDAILMETLLDRSGEGDLLATDRDGNTALHYSYAFCQAQISTMLEDQMDGAVSNMNM